VGQKIETKLRRLAKLSWHEIPVLTEHSEHKVSAASKLFECKGLTAPAYWGAVSAAVIRINAWLAPVIAPVGEQQHLGAEVH
jgi:hypothetical protein